MLVEHGHRYALGSLDPFDAHLPAGRLLVEDVLRSVRRGSIIILNEGRPDRFAAAGLLGVLLAGLGARDRDVITVTGLLALAGPSRGAGPSADTGPRPPHRGRMRRRPRRSGWRRR